MPADTESLNEDEYVFACNWCEKARAVFEDASWHACDYCGDASKVCAECSKESTLHDWAPL
jgi:rRNA maturation endonuclease Nob1